MENIIIPDPGKLENLKKRIKEEGLEKLHVISDFDKTLTHAFFGKDRIPSVISVLREDKKYLGEDYAIKARELFEKYHPIEINPEIENSEKKKLMREWWTSHFKILIDTGLNKRHLKEVVESGRIRLREGSSKFFNFLNSRKIPLIIMSASGLGEAAIAMLLERAGEMHPDIHIISNSFLWDEEGGAVGFKEPIIHSLNKDETVVKNFSCYEAVKGRKNVLLLGDNLEDVEMIKGFDYDNLVKIGFFNDRSEDNLPYYEKNYDALILNDSSMDFINNFLIELS